MYREPRFYDFDPDDYTFRRRLPPGPGFRDTRRPGLNWAAVSVLVFTAVFWTGVYFIWFA